MVNDDTLIPRSVDQRAHLRSTDPSDQSMTSSRRRRGALVPLVVVASLIISSCGDDDEDPAATTAEQGDGDAAEEATSTSEGGGEGQEFTDPQGLYRLTIDPAWTVLENPLLGPEGESWQVAEEVDGMTPNLGLSAEPSRGLDLEGFIEENLASSGVLEEFQLIDRRTVEGDGGAPLGILDFTARVQDVPMHFLSATFIEGDQAVTATLAVAADRFDEVRSSVEPFMHTLQPA